MTWLRSAGLMVLTDLIVGATWLPQQKLIAAMGWDGMGLNGIGRDVAFSKVNLAALRETSSPGAST